MTAAMRDFEQRTDILIAELKRSEESACQSLDRTLIEGPQQGSYPARYWAREIAVVRGALTAIEESKSRIYSNWQADQ